MIKSELDGARVVVLGHEASKRQELCRLIALGYRFYLQNALKGYSEGSGTTLRTRSAAR